MAPPDLANKFTRASTPTERAFAGTAAMLIGAGILPVGAGWVPKALDGMRAPLWVILAAGGVFALAGLSMLLHERVPAWVTGLIGNLLWTLFAAIPAWIAWGDGQGQITGSGITLAWLLHFDAQAMGRFAFSAAAILMMSIAAAVWWQWLSKLDRRTSVYVLPALGLAGYALFVVMPAEPNWPDVHDDHARLARYVLLSGQEGWLDRKGSAPAAWYYPPWRNFEHWTQAARSRLAAARVAPPDAMVRTVPVAGGAPAIDGRIGVEEWRGALRIELAPAILGSSVLLSSDGKRLYLAADAPADTTRTGYDQFRFILHIGLSPWLENERVSVDRHGNATALRTQRVPQETGAPKWRTGWRIYERARGATVVEGHRQYELQIDLAEAGIKPGVPFEARIEIEGDPLLNEAGKFKSRVHLGDAGGKRSPLWLRVGGVPIHQQAPLPGNR